MQDEFYFKPRLGLGDMWGILGGLALILVPVFYPFSIGKGSLILVPYPWSKYLLMAIGVVVLIIDIRRHWKEFKLRGASGLIIIENETLTYPAVVEGAVQNVSFQLKDVELARYDDEDEDFIVVTNDSKEHKFDKTYFSDLGEFQRFKDLFRKK